MRIELSIKDFDYQSVVNNSKLTSSEKEQLTELFQKIIKKSYLGVGASSRLQYLLGKIENANIVLVPKNEKHHFILKTKEMSEILIPHAIAKVYERVGKYEKTPLQMAINNYTKATPEEKPALLIKIMELLNDPAIDINLTDKEGWSAAYQAIQLSDPQVLLMIVKMPGIRPNSKNIDGSTPLIRAADTNNVEAVKILLEKKVKIDATNDVGTALAYAAHKGHKEIVSLLIQANADVNKVSDSLGMTALKLAQQGGHAEIVEMLKAAGGLKAPLPTQLQTLVKVGGQPLLDYLSRDVNVADEYGRTAAHYWAHEPNDEAGKILQEMGANFNVQDKYKRTPLHYACMQGHQDAVITLLKHGVNVNHEDKLKYSPLFWAAQYDKLEVVRILIGQGADVNHTDKFDWTALDKAAGSKSAKVCEFLCQQSDVQINRKAADGRTALDKAKVNGASECIAILLKYAAKGQK